jgi:hypothetical protein
MVKTINDYVHIETVKPNKGSSLIRYLVRVGPKAERVIGFIDHFRDDKYTENPYKAFKSNGARREPTKLGVFYKDDGGKKAAINDIFANYHGIM